MIKRSGSTLRLSSAAAARRLAQGQPHKPCAGSAGRAERWSIALGLLAAATLSACGGGTAAPVAVSATTTITGSVVKGPVTGAQVCGFSISGNARGAALGSCVTTDASGAYSLVLPAGSGPLWLEATGGSYTDETTALLTALPSGAALTSLVTANGAAISAMLTPLTTLALNAAQANAGSTGTLDAAAFQAAATQLLATFSLPATLDIATTQPAFGSNANAYGLALASISRLLSTAGAISLADLLATIQPSTLQAAFAAAVAANNAAIGTTAGTTTGSTAGSTTGATTGTTSGGTTLSAALPLVISAATPSSWNGTLSAASVQFEHGSSAATGAPYDNAQPYCRVAGYGLVNSGDGIAHFLDITFRKDTKVVGLVQYGLDASLATQSREAGPVAGLTIDTANRRITFVNVVIGTNNSSTTLTLNGTIDYPTNVAPENRAACG